MRAAARSASAPSFPGTTQCQPFRQIAQEAALRLVVPIRLPDRASMVPDRLMGCPRGRRALHMRGKIGVLMGFLRVKTGKFPVTFVFQNQCLAAVTDDNPVARTDAGFFMLTSR